jgi:hypothetical protein
MITKMVKRLVLIAAFATAIILPMGTPASATACSYEVGVHTTVNAPGKSVHTCVGVCIDGCPPFSFHVQ